MANPDPFPFIFKVMLKTNHLKGQSRVQGPCQHKENNFFININALKLIQVLICSVYLLCFLILLPEVVIIFVLFKYIQRDDISHNIFFTRHYSLSMSNELGYFYRAVYVCADRCYTGGWSNSSNSIFTIMTILAVPFLVSCMASLPSLVLRSQCTATVGKSGYTKQATSAIHE